MNARYFSLILVLFVFSCQDDLDPKSREFRVIVEQDSDISCSLPVIRFLDREDEVKAKTKNAALSYNALYLDESLNVIGDELIIEFAEVRDEDLRICVTIGIHYPGIRILKARKNI